MKIAGIIVLISVLFFITGNFILGEPDSNDIKKRQSELERLNKSIKDTRNRINSLSKKEKNAVNKLQLNQKHNLELVKYMNLLDAQITGLQNEIKQYDSIYYQLSYDLSALIVSYTKYISDYYIEGYTDDAEAVLADASLNDDLRKEIYKGYINKFINSEVKKINSIRVEVSNQSGALKDKFDYQEELKNTKQREQKNLAYSINKNKSLIAEIKKDSKLLGKQLHNKINSAEKIKKIIADLIRKEAEKSNTETKNLPVGKISWPCESKVIIRSYGNIKNKETNTYFDNPGIDISSKNGSSVKAIADGEASLIHYLPGYGTLIILNHGNNLRSVYANLSSVRIKKGDKVKKGGVIGSSGESVEGEFLHFELWQGKTRLNPADYLK